MLATTVLLALAPFAIAKVRIHPMGDTSKCIVAPSHTYHWLRVVGIADCTGAPNEYWELSRGPTHIKSADAYHDGTCAQAGTGMTGVPHIENAAIGSSLQTCRDTLGQKWYYSVKRVEVEGKGFCWDVKDGNLGPDGYVQLWECARGNGNQVFTTSD